VNISLKALEYEESTRRLSASHQTIRSSMALYGAVIAMILGFVYNQELALDTRAYLAMFSVSYTAMMILIQMSLTKRKQYFEIRVENIEREIDINVHRNSPHSSELLIYFIIYILAGIGFVIASTTYVIIAEFNNAFIYRFSGYLVYSLALIIWLTTVLALYRFIRGNMCKLPSFIGK
jgi:hypothetical protein